MNAINRNCIADRIVSSKACSIFTFNKIKTNKLIKQSLLIYTFNLITCLILTTKRLMKRHTFYCKFYFNKTSTYGKMYFAELIEQSRALMTNLALMFPAQKIKMYFHKIIQS